MLVSGHSRAAVDVVYDFAGAAHGKKCTALLISGPEITRYDFPGRHPLGTDRHAAFMARLDQSLAHSLAFRDDGDAVLREALTDELIMENEDRLADHHSR